MYPQGCDVCNHLSLFLCVADYDKLLPGWCHFAQFTIAVVNKDPKKSKYSGGPALQAACMSMLQQAVTLSRFIMVLRIPLLCAAPPLRQNLLLFALPCLAGLRRVMHEWIVQQTLR